MNYAAIRAHVKGLPWVALVTTGRTGSDFLQSLFDSHPEVFVFTGELFFHEFWAEARCTQSAADLAEEFTGQFLYKLKSRYDLEERKDRLGENQDQSLDLDPAEFRAHLVGVHGEGPVTPRTFLTAVYVAWALCLGQDPLGKRLFLHHIHHIWKLPNYLRDFPDTRILGMTRDPRANWVSGVEHWVKVRHPNAHAWTVWFTLNRAIEDVQGLALHPNEYRAIRLEDLGSRPVLEALCAWLGVSYHECLQESTWGGLRWWGDRLSSRVPQSHERGYSPTVARNRWEDKLPERDRFLLDYLLAARLRHYGYPVAEHGGPGAAFKALWSIPLPLRYERQVTFLALLKTRTPRQWAKVFYYYGRRVALFYGLWARRVTGRAYRAPFIRCE